MKVFGRKMRNIKDIILNMTEREREREIESERKSDTKTQRSSRFLHLAQGQFVYAHLTI